jgi:hypothetical protein
MNLSKYDLKLGPNEVLCIGCSSIKSRMQCDLGKLNIGIHFAEVKTEELHFDPQTGKVTLEEVDKKVPIGQWKRGWICRSCSSDYRTVTHIRKDGSKWYEPRVQLQRSSTQSTTLNPGESRMTSSPPPHDDGFGFQTDLTPEPELDRACYSYFSGHRGKRGSREEIAQTNHRPKSDAQKNAEASR